MTKMRDATKQTAAELIVRCLENEGVEYDLDEGAMWPTSFALKELTDTEEAKISALVKRAVSQAGS